MKKGLNLATQSNIIDESFGYVGKSLAILLAQHYDDSKKVLTMDVVEKIKI